MLDIANLGLLVPFQLNGASYLLLGSSQKAFRTEHSE